MNLFVQGMRRSGTTILYDALLEDPGLRCFYEPFREEKVTEGGGSGAHEGDVFAETRELRHRFRAEHHPDLEPDEVNWGGPREPRLEVGPELPEHCRGFLAHLLEQGAEVAIKFTRVYDKLKAVAGADPTAALVHVVRDPRAVTASIMLGRGRRRAERFPTPDDFFAERSKRMLWSSRGISQELMRQPRYAAIRRPTDVERILLVWRHTFESTWRDGRGLFGDRYLLLRNEDLRADPSAALASVYSLLGRGVPDDVSSWASENVRGVEEPYAGDDPGWGRAFARVEMRDALDDAGYPDLAAAVPESGAAERIGGTARRARRRLGAIVGR